MLAARHIGQIAYQVLQPLVLPAELSPMQFKCASAGLMPIWAVLIFPKCLQARGDLARTDPALEWVKTFRAKTSTDGSTWQEPPNVMSNRALDGVG